MMIVEDQEALLKEKLIEIKLRIMILDLIEARLKEIKALAIQVADREYSREEIADFQLQVNNLVEEINSLDRVEMPRVLH
ncbi:MAG: hypothetical protein HGA27_08360 [Peptococcaceae bacterium]|nr:hypothetical protein [Peptococcaceae bacterium]